MKTRRITQPPVTVDDLRHRIRAMQRLAEAMLAELDRS